MTRAAFCAVLIAGAIVSVASANQADDLFQKALVAEQSGDLAARDRLIAATLEADPEFKLARWHSGQVLHNGKWQSLEEIEQSVARDPRYQEYADRVAAGEDSLDAHAVLARWCRLLGLDLEEQWHWVNVLRHDGKNREALGALKLRPYRGTYLTAEEIKASEAAEEQAEADFRRYSKLIKSAMRDAERNDGPARTAAIKKISSINDPAAVTALVEVVLADAKNEQRILDKFGSEKGEKLVRQLQQAAIGALGEMSEHEATLTLMDVALCASDAQIRKEAAELLKYREMTAYVPLLMAQLASPIELSIAVNTLPNGRITVLKDFYEEGPTARRRHAVSTDYLTQFILKETTTIPGTRRRLERFGVLKVARVFGVWTNHLHDAHNATADIVSTEEQVAAENERREESNRRVNEVLAVAFDKEFDNDPMVWWDAWKNLNELYTPDVEYETAETLDRTTQFVQEVRYGRTASCFVAGTPVWTQAGMVPIEELNIGDLVLSQDPDTGELNYRPVIDRTVRPPTGTVKLSVDHETIVATRGHRFWTADKGWMMAKFLKAGEQLVRAKGLIDLQAAEAGEDAEAYNLEIGEFHTYFVSKNRVLVHDNTCPQPTTNHLPGVPGPRTVVHQVALQR